jgi:hypothetical protein
MKSWTSKEIGRLRQLYPVLSAAELEREFHPRTGRAIRHRAALLKIKKANWRDWADIARKHQPVIFWGAKQ